MCGLPVKHLKIRVTGRVQGVFYRDTARGEAESLGLSGWARNERDGSVAIEVEGEEAALNKFLGWCRRGSRWARVDSVQVRDGEVANFSGFQIRY